MCVCVCVAGLKGRCVLTFEIYLQYQTMKNRLLGTKHTLRHAVLSWMVPQWVRHQLFVEQVVEELPTEEPHRKMLR